MKAGVATAPGKVVLCGEYAVLHGYPAIAAAVERRARVQVAPLDRDYFELTTRGFMPGTWRLRKRVDGTFACLDRLPEPRGLQLAEHAIAVLCPDVAGGWAVTLDTSGFVASDGGKLGIGSSAALAVAMTAALSVDMTPEKLFGRARRIHEAFQGGGSGVDIACAVHGGILCYRDGVGVEPSLALPAGLHCRILSSGRPASTRQHLARLRVGLQHAQGRASLVTLGRMAERVVAGWHESSAETLLESLVAYSETLEALDNVAELGIFAGGHAALARRARAAGLLFKPCGAGGGDIGTVLATSERALDDFVAAAGADGFAVLETTLGAAGLSRQN